MAIDKSLPNKKVEIPGPQEQAEQQIDIQENLPDQGETEITPLMMVVLKLILNQEHLAKNKVKVTLII